VTATPGIRYRDPYWGLDEGEKSSHARLDELDLKVGDKLFDFGDEWRVRLTLAEVRPASSWPCPAILESRGEAPQYSSDDEELEGVA
jgi:hypothetical protein